MVLESIKRVVIDVETDSDGVFIQEMQGWSGWYLNAIRIFQPTNTSDRLATLSIVDILDPDINEYAWSAAGNKVGTFHPLINPHSTSGSIISGDVERSFKFFDKIRVEVSEGGTGNKLTIHLFLSTSPL